MSIGKFELEVTGATTAYLRLPTYPEVRQGRLRTVTLVDLMGQYQGPYIVFDFDKNNVLVGIEIVGDDTDSEDEESEV